MKSLLFIIMCLLPLTVMGDDAKPKPKPLTAQQVAQARADYMAKYNHRGHPPYNIPNNRLWRVSRFEGAGWSGSNANPKRIGTCTPRYKMTLVGDAWAKGKYGTYRIRLWK